MSEPGRHTLPEGRPPEVEHCDRCHHRWLAKRGFCPRCGNDDTRMEAVPGEAVVHAVTVVHRAVQESAIGPAPYRIVLAKLDTCPEVTIMALAPEAVEIGEPVTVTRHGADGAPYLALP
ncbi:MAG: OB-fold domain-containing protein [Ectothiorhodospiraceae bacterium]|nr:OB-fold domain-containing protein [Ectothiorhodospiraceae bacterium]